VKQAKNLVSELTEKELLKSAVKGYFLAERSSNYGGIAQRGLILYSHSDYGFSKKKLMIVCLFLLKKLYLLIIDNF
jgi:hypothetical protein